MHAEVRKFACRRIFVRPTHGFDPDAGTDFKVVFHLAGDHTGIAADAPFEINGKYNGFIHDSILLTVRGKDAKILNYFRANPKPILLQPARHKKPYFP